MFMKNMGIGSAYIRISYGMWTNEWIRFKVYAILFYGCFMWAFVCVCMWVLNRNHLCTFASYIQIFPFNDLSYFAAGGMSRKIF